MKNAQTAAVTFGRFNLPHPGHVDLVRKMLSVADMAFVAISASPVNNDYVLRRDVLHSLCGFAGLDLERIRFFPAGNVFMTVEDFAENYETVTLVLGVDQTQLGEKLRDTFNVAFVPNEVRIGSSTVIRYFLEEGEEVIVREIYHNSPVLFDQVVALRNQELARSGN